MLYFQESSQMEYIEAEIKKIMNGMNKKLQSQFEPSKYYSGQEVKETIASTIKVGYNTFFSKA